MIDGSGTASARCVLAPNPSPMTLDGTNTWILAAPSAERVIVIDPGPQDPGHLQRVRAVAEAGGRRVEEVLLTHGHPDHSAGAAEFARLAGARRIRSLDPQFRLGDEGLGEADVVTLDGLTIEVLATPGHSFDSLCFWLPADGAILTGDTVLGSGTTVIAPDGGLADYLHTLDRLRDFTEHVAAQSILPGHGRVLDDPLGALDFYIAHRRERLLAIEAAMAAGARTPLEIVGRVYTDVDPSVWPAAEWSVRAQLDYLKNRRG